MAGRKSHHDRSGERREQSSKQARGNARGHGAYHRHQEGRGAPRKVASGKDRTMDIVRHQGFSRLQDDDLADLSAGEKRLMSNIALKNPPKQPDSARRWPGPRGARHRGRSPQRVIF